MGLPALEFSDCYVDSPQFRERLKSHELELEKTNKFIKELIKDGNALIQALKYLSTAKRKFAESLNEFKFQCIGDAETDDEICIAKSLQEFAGVLQNLEDERTRMIENANDVLISPLERFRKEQIGAAKVRAECFIIAVCCNGIHSRERLIVFSYQEVPCSKAYLSLTINYYCIYHREPKRMTMMLFDQKSVAKNGDEESFTLKSCTRRKTDSIEKRFCFDIEAVDRPGVITMQALSEEDRRLWMEAMDGREPVYTLNRDSQNEYMSKCDSLWFSLTGIDEQGLYRIVGVNSRVQKLLSLAMDPKTCADVELDSTEWEIKTITSAIKHYLRMLPAPLMTYQYQRSFIKAAKLDNPEARVAEIHSIVHRLPEKNRQMLELLMKHLAKVASHHQQNLMTVANLGVVFGPTLLRPQEETVAAIMDIKFQNIVVEILIENHERVWQGNSQLNLPRRRSTDSKAPSCSERPLTLFHNPSFSEKVKGTPASSFFINACLRVCVCRSPASPSPTSPRSPSWPMFSAPSSPRLASSTSSESSPVRCVSCSGLLSPPLRKARALYACKAEHDSELSFIAGTIFENVHPSREPGWLEGTLDGKTGLIPENYVAFV
uniref:Rho GTPase-activating protein 26 n=1 Tax=Sinocyclocheilus grahami TaxID=75366 RepID=A0A672R689_SINGR